MLGLYYICRSRIVRKFTAQFVYLAIVVASYGFNNDVFHKGDATRLPQLVHDVTEDMAKIIESYKKRGITDVGFFNTSLGAFVQYQAVAKIPEFSWRVLSTGGDIAAGSWKIKKANGAFTKNGCTLPKLQTEWHTLQYPEFKTDLQHAYFVFVGSDHGPITALRGPRDFASYINKRSSARTEIVKIRGLGHSHTALIGLTKARALIHGADLSS